MENNKIKKMNLNKETAMRIWIKQFGKCTKAVDFSGRTIAKGAYNDRNSDYGWNVDHILPESKGGVTADHNLLCCHIKTNDEKANKFPCFNANDKKFKIIKVENHYEVKEVDNTKNDNIIQKNDTNFFDSASGIRTIKKINKRINRSFNICSISIKLKKVNNCAIFEFVKEIFDNQSMITIDYQKKKPNIPHLAENQQFISTITIHNLNVNSIEGVKEILDKCVLLNTYLSAYFVPLNHFSEYDIYLKLFEFDSYDQYLSSNIDFNIKSKDLNNSIFIHKEINGLINGNNKENNNVQSSIDILVLGGSFSEWTEYNYVYTQLEKNLNKEVKGK